MLTRHHPLKGSPLGTHREIVSFHFGPQGTGRKVYVQASLHADELPGMLVAHHLRQRLDALERAGKLRARWSSCRSRTRSASARPCCSPTRPIRARQRENFNRHYPALFDKVVPLLEGRLGDDEAANAQVIRAALRSLIAALPEGTELMSQRKTLLGLACDAEVVLDLHCDAESLLHLYTGTALWPQCEPLARLTGARASLLASESGDNPFDEACSQTWWQLRGAFSRAGTWCRWVA